ncbi:MAG TPA: hypothetical protein ENK66_10015 [Arcobacter sp.]|nr:hypothetical protein [Arcobacter sp.]
MKDNQNKKLGKRAFIIAWLSFVPVFGIFFALIAIMILLSTDETEGRKRYSIITGIGFIYSLVIVTIFLYMEFQRYTVAAA